MPTAFSISLPGQEGGRPNEDCPRYRVPYCFEYGTHRLGYLPSLRVLGDDISAKRMSAQQAASGPKVAASFPPSPALWTHRPHHRHGGLVASSCPRRDLRRRRASIPMLDFVSEARPELPHLLAGVAPSLPCHHMQTKPSRSYSFIS